MCETVILNKDLPDIYHTTVPKVVLREGDYRHYYVNDDDINIDFDSHKCNAVGRDIIEELEELGCKGVFFDDREVHFSVRDQDKECVIEYLSSFYHDIVV